MNRIDPSGKQEGCPEWIPMCNDPWYPLRLLWESVVWATEHPAQTWGLPDDSLKTLMLEDWLFEKKKSVRYFDSLHPITQLLMNHQGVNKIRYKFYYENQCKPIQEWIKVEGPPYLNIYFPQYEFPEKPVYGNPYGRPVASEVEPLINKTVSLGGAYNFVESNIILGYEITTASDDTPDTIMGALGSYRVTIVKSDDNMARFEVYNLTGRESFTRDYAYPPLTIMSNQTRDETEPFLFFRNGWGGDMEEFFEWTESIPDGICNCKN
ncbi:hypothetical protein ACFLXQ_08955 [Chloroflexota bacterium]